MTISKKLFLVAALGLGLQVANISAIHSTVNNTNQEDTDGQQVFNFACDLQKQSDNADAIIAGQWLEKQILAHYSVYYNTIDRIIIVLNAELSLEEKIAHILQIKRNQEESIDQDKVQQAQGEQARKRQEQLNSVVQLVKIITLPAITVISLRFGWDLASKLSKALFIA